MRALALAWALLALLVWRTGASTLRLVDEALAVRGARLGAACSLPEDERIRRALADWERRSGLEPGREAEVWKALRAHVPPDARLHVSAEREELASKLAYVHLAVLLYPVRLAPVESIPPGWRDGVAAWTGRDHLLELGRLTAEPLGEAFEPLAAGDGWRLWRRREDG